MSRKDSGNGWLYAGVGAVVAVGAGYLVWRYALSEDTRQKVRTQVRSALQRGAETDETGGLDADFQARVPVGKARIVTGEVALEGGKPTRVGSVRP